MIPYCKKGGTQAVMVRYRGWCKNYKKYFFSHLHYIFLYTTFISKIHEFSKRFMRSTIHVQGANTFTLHNQPPNLDSLPLFLGYSHSFGNNKAQWRFLFDLCESSQSDGFVSTFLPLQKKNGDFTGERLSKCWSIYKWLEPIFVYLCMCYYLLYMFFLDFPGFQGAW